MSRRLAVREVVLTALVAVGWLGPVAVAGQGRQATGTAAKTSSPGPYTRPKTPDGQPDLQGFWTNSTYTPLERPKGVEKELLYTRRSGSRDQAGRAARKRADDTWHDRRRALRLHAVRLDRSQAPLAENLRTSLIVDPPDGKVPPLTDEGRKRAAARAEAEKRLGGRWDSAESNQLDDRCLIMAGAGPPMMNAAYNAQLPDCAGARLRDDPHRDDPRRADRAAGRAPATR